MREELQENTMTGSESIIEKQKEKIRQQKEQLKRHEETWRMYNKIVFTLCTLLGSVFAIYVGGWIMFAKSIFGTYEAYLAGTLTVSYLIKAAIKCDGCNRGGSELVRWLYPWQKTGTIKMII